VTIGKGAGALAVSVMILLSQACDSQPTSSPQRDRVVSQEPVRPAPPAPPEESKSPPPAEVAPPPVASPRTSAPATPAKPRPSRESVPPAESPTTKPSGPTQAQPAMKESTPETPRPEPAPSTGASAPPPATPAGTLDLGSLEKRLRDTKAIGVFTKLSLKNQVDDLLEEFREFHQSHDQSLLAKLRQAYDLLLLKVLSLLQDNDPTLARDISSSREALWNILTDPDKFQNL
jgi:hypothetical protein